MAGFSLAAVLFLFLSFIAAAAVAVIICAALCAMVRMAACGLLFRKAGEPLWAVFVPLWNVCKTYKLPSEVSGSDPG